MPLTRPGRTIGFLAKLPEHAAFAYATILGLQLKVMWGFWSGLDLSGGDTASYFTVAREWASSLTNAIFWSPLYTAFYGTVLKITNDAVSATIAHRVVIVFGVTTLVLALARLLLPSAVAWLVAAWWAILPINFDTFNEVHLFGVIPSLVAALLLARRSSHLMRAAALAILLASAVLVRNEIALAAAAFGIVCLWFLLRDLRKDRSLGSLFRIVRPYALALTLAGLSVVLFYTRSSIQFPVLYDVIDARQEVNFCQAYAFNYLQRHPEGNTNPFTQCAPLIESTFGEGSPTFSEAARRNPAAIGEYLAWNARLIPYGVQLALFDETSGVASPDYIAVRVKQILPLILSFACLVLVGAGVLVARTDLPFWREWVRRRKWPFIALGCSSLAVLLVMFQQRPRPSYMFALTFAVMVCMGLCLVAISRRLTMSNVVAAAVPVLAAVSLVLAPSHYAGGQRPLRDAYVRLKPYASERSDPITVVPGYGRELCNYLARPLGCKIHDYWGTVRVLAIKTGSLDRALEQLGATLFYADSGVLADPLAASTLKQVQPTWRKIAGDGDQWILLRRESAE